jgi:hypothetical protein
MRALNAQHDAFERYRLALMAFNKFILYGELSEVASFTKNWV